MRFPSLPHWDKLRYAVNYHGRTEDRLRGKLARVGQAERFRVYETPCRTPEDASVFRTDPAHAADTVSVADHARSTEKPSRLNRAVQAAEPLPVRVGHVVNQVALIPLPAARRLVNLPDGLVQARGDSGPPSRLC